MALREPCKVRLRLEGINNPIWFSNELLILVCSLFIILISFPDWSF